MPLFSVQSLQVVGFLTGLNYQEPRHYTTHYKIVQNHY